MHQRAAQRELLLHPAGQRGGASVLERFELAVDWRDVRALALDGGTEYRREEPQVFVDAEIRIQRKPPRHVADAAAQFPEVLDDVKTEHACGSLVRDQQRGEHAQQRGLAATVRTNEAEELGRGDGE